jgi:hypothetical protein
LSRVGCASRRGTPASWRVRAAPACYMAG